MKSSYSVKKLKQVPTKEINEGLPEDWGISRSIPQEATGAITPQALLEIKSKKTNKV